MSGIVEILVETGNERRKLFGKGLSMLPGDYVYENNGSSVVVSAHMDAICDYVRVSRSLIYSDTVTMYVGTDIISDDLVFGRLDNTVGVAFVKALKEIYGQKLNYLFTNKEEVGGLGAEAFCKNEYPDKNALVVNFDISDDDYLMRKDGIGLVAYCYDTTPDRIKNILNELEIEILKPRFNDSFVFEEHGIATVSLHIQIEQMHGVVEYSKLSKIEKAFELAKMFIDKILEGRQ
jgi:putative aminopeptidase FrvX